MTDPFDSGKDLVFKSMSTTGTKLYLNSSPGASKSTSVYLSDSLDYTKNPGCHWKCSLQSVGVYFLQCKTPHGEKTYLDSSSKAPRDESVYLNDASAGSGSHWSPIKLLDDGYSLESSTSGLKHFMHANPTGSKEDSVYLVDNSGAIETHWMVGVDYYNESDVQRIIHGVYPSLTINFYQEEDYGSLEYEAMYDIWKNSKVDDYKYKPSKFDYNDYAVCMKTEVSKYSYNQKLPTDKGSLCGIIWGKDAKEPKQAYAFNFTIDPFENLVLFDPFLGQQIGYDEYIPSFCMV